LCFSIIFLLNFFKLYYLTKSSSIILNRMVRVDMFGRLLKIWVYRSHPSNSDSLGWEPRKSTFKARCYGTYLQYQHSRGLWVQGQLVLHRKTLSQNKQINKKTHILQVFQVILMNGSPRNTRWTKVLKDKFYSPELS
jgi:hypothetical protein